MSRPKVIAENISNVVDYYADHRPNRMARAGYWALRGIFHPDVEFDEGAEQQITDILSDPTQRIIIAANHIYQRDPVELAPLLTRKCLRPMVAKTLILAKTELFRAPVIRPLIDGMGAVPVFRPKDGLGPKELLSVNQSLFEHYSQIINEGHHFIAHIEGARNKENPTQLMKAGKGLAHIALDTDENVGLHLMTVGIWYPRNIFGKHDLNADMHVSMPIEIDRATATPTNFTNTAHESLQRALDHAVQMD